VGLLAGHQELGGIGVGLQRVGGDHRAGEVEVGEQVRCLGWSERISVAQGG
jgi:hypothetical protein